MTEPFECFLEHHGLSQALTKFIICREHIERIRDQLDIAGIDERRLFPDLDGVAKETRR